MYTVAAGSTHGFEHSARVHVEASRLLRHDDYPPFSLAA